MTRNIYDEWESSQDFQPNQSLIEIIEIGKFIDEIHLSAKEIFDKVAERSKSIQSKGPINYGIVERGILEAEIYLKSVMDSLERAKTNNNRKPVNLHQDIEKWL